MKIIVTTQVRIERTDKTITTLGREVIRNVGDNPARERGEVRTAVRDAAVAFSVANNLDESNREPL